MKRKKLMSAMAVLIAGLAVATSAVAAKPPDRTTVCHSAGNSGNVIELQLPEPAVRAHLRHGDVLLGAFGYCP